MVASRLLVASSSFRGSPSSSYLLHRGLRGTVQQRIGNACRLWSTTSHYFPSGNSNGTGTAAPKTTKSYTRHYTSKGFSSATCTRASSSILFPLRSSLDESNVSQSQWQQQLPQRHGFPSHIRSFSSSSSSSSPTTSSGSDENTNIPPIDSHQHPPPFTKILIANRGEIALRVHRTCQKLSIPTVAVHSTADTKSLHVQIANERICIGPPESLASYLNIDNIIKAIELTGADGVHPGYGFLSENPEFCKRVKEMDHVTFIGPNENAMILMGDKIQSKNIAEEAGVNVIPGYDGVIENVDHAVEVAKQIGYPVMIKASAGGGGKGMRICTNEEEVREGYGLSKAEAASFFGDDRLLVEKYIVNPHHIEFQVLAGRKHVKKSKKMPATMNPFPILDGKDYEPLEVVVFPERECSIQRRNQKIIEESPSVLLTPETRAKMASQVKALVRKVNYTSAGTVEFLVDEEQNFYFLEMNTRLQVEHPITEMVTGVDLVEGMIRVAAGEGVPEEILAKVRGAEEDGGEEKKKEEEAPDGENDTTEQQHQDDGATVPFVGHAIETRVYAEDPIRGFLPSTGPLLQYIEPPPISQPSMSEGEEVGSDSDSSSVNTGMISGECQIRCDSGVTSGSNISQYYDPMLSKLISYSPQSRDHAIDGLADAIDRYVIRGVRHNTPFSRDVLRNESFRKGETPTNFIELHYPDGFEGVTLTNKEKGELAAIVGEIGRVRLESLCGPPLPLSHGEGGGDAGGGGSDDVVVCLGGMFGDAYLVRRGEEVSVVEPLGPRNASGDLPDAEDDDSGTTTTSEEGGMESSGADANLGGEEEVEQMVQVVRLDSVEYDPANIIAEVEIDGSRRALQVHGEDNTGQITITMFGAEITALVMSPKEYELSLHMNEPSVVDTSDMILSPMPGTLVSYAVEEGDQVEMGQELCIVEAMKMQNILRSPRAGVVSSCRAEVGSSLSADEIIIEFAPEEESVAAAG